MMGCSATMLLGALLVVTLFIWGAVTFVGLTRFEVRLEQSWSHMENAFLHRQSLVVDLVELAGRSPGIDRELVRQVEGSAAEASRFVLTPELLNEPALSATFRDAQEHLEHDLDSLLEACESSHRLRSPETYERLKAQLERTDARLEDATNRFNDATIEYNRQLARFPQKVVAELFEFRSKPLWFTATAPEAR
jgi:LemA protein